MANNKFCTECGSKLPKVAKFCEECGVELALVQMKTTEEPKEEVAEPTVEEPKVSEIEITEEPEEEEVMSESMKGISAIVLIIFIFCLAFLIMSIIL